LGVVVRLQVSQTLGMADKALHPLLFLVFQGLEEMCRLGVIAV
jgi:hypothetical protein